MIVRYILAAILIGLLVTLAFQSGLVAIDAGPLGFDLYVGPLNVTEGTYNGSTWFPGQYL